MHTQTLKITGVRPGRLPMLHYFLESEQNRAFPSGDVMANSIVMHSSVKDNHCKCRLLKSDYNPQFGTYTVEVEVPITLPVVDSPERTGKPGLIGNHGLVFVSRKLVCDIYVALGIYPEEQKLGTKDRTVQLWEENDENPEE